MKPEIKERIEMINRGEVPEGYKKNKTLIIPYDWEIKKIKLLSNVLRGASPRPISLPKWFKENSNIGWVRISDVSKAKKKLEKTEQYLSEEGVKKSRFIKKNNLIMSICATVGKPIITNFDVCIHDGFVVFEDIKVDKEFFYYALTKIENKWVKYGQTGSQMNLNTNIVGNENIVMPNFYEEQQKIATILSTWDKAIELKEKLIEKKKEQKKGLMQKLLTGKVRLPGFEGEWEEVKLGDLLNNKTEKSKINNQYPVLSCTKDGVISQKDCFNKQIASKNNIGYKILRKRELVLSTMNLWLGSIDISKYEIGIVSPSYKIYEVNYKLVGENFFRNLLRSEYMIFKYNSISQKGASVVRRNLNIKDFESLFVKIPSEKIEMDKIDKLIGLFSREIDLLEKELETLKLQKKCLMQLLLTGIVRVKC